MPRLSPLPAHRLVLILPCSYPSSLLLVMHFSSRKNYFSPQRIAGGCLPRDEESLSDSNHSSSGQFRYGQGSPECQREPPLTGHFDTMNNVSKSRPDTMC